MVPPEQKRRQRIIIALVVLVVAGLVFLAFKLGGSPNKPSVSTGSTNIYHDPVSGEDIIDQQGKSKEGEVSTSTTPTYAGFDKLLDVGLTLPQLQSVYTAFEQYKPFASDKVEISLAVDDIQSVQPSTSDPLYRWAILSHVVVNRTTSYGVKIYFWDEGSAELVLTNGNTSQQVFDSGAITSSTAHN
ncbi:MAG TPA: hypothetical protein VLE99_00525 [Candidatus Saccharimonadales bacterium]|nr:hypothetical protein [Candidatus Saccharimonadales bacterium]